jgi:hypothetical protein
MMAVATLLDFSLLIAPLLLCLFFLARQLFYQSTGKIIGDEKYPLKVYDQ